MLIAEAKAPTYPQLRHARRSKTFPVYHGLVDHLAKAKLDSGDPDPVVAHLLGTCAGYAYSDAETVSTIMARMGLDKNHCLAIGQSVDAMFIRSTAFLVQSACGRVVVIAYRGTEPVNPINWLTDADVNPDRVDFPVGGANGPCELHGGFYRNVRATRYQIAEALERAFRGEPLSRVRGRRPRKLDHALQRIYITGHSLGGAMAAVLAVLLAHDTDDAYVRMRNAVAAVWTFGQPMVATPALAKACRDDKFLSAKLRRFIHGHDVVPAVPPTASGSFAHFGREYRFHLPGAVAELRNAVTNSTESFPDQLDAIRDRTMDAVSDFSEQLGLGYGLPVPKPVADVGGALAGLMRHVENARTTVLQIADKATEPVRILGGKVFEQLKLMSPPATLPMLGPKMIPQLPDPSRFLTWSGDLREWFAFPAHRVLDGCGARVPGQWLEHPRLMSQVSNLAELALAPLAFATHQVQWLKFVPFQFSLYDHGPQHYIAALRPPNVRSEFGD
jgi:hypothetical protein